MKKKLINFSEYRNERIDCDKLTNKNYVSVDNMIKDRGGISYSNYLPESGSTQSFKKNDILIGNIRPYFKKIWLAEFDGGCSPDVLVIKPSLGVNPYLLYSVLSSDHFFDYDMAGSKGSKMPRGDKKHIMDYPIYINLTNNKIGYLIYLINKKVSLNNKAIQQLNKNLTIIFNYWFVQFDFLNISGEPYKTSGETMIFDTTLKYEIPETWKVAKLGDLITINDKSPIQVQQAAKSLGSVPFFTSGDEVLYVEDKLVSGLNIYMSTGGVASIKIFNGDASYSTDTWSFSANKMTAFLYFYLSAIRKQINDNFFAGSSLKHLQKEQLKDMTIPVPADEFLDKFNSVAHSAFYEYSVNLSDNFALIKLRNFLLPMLITGQATIKV